MTRIQWTLVAVVFALLYVTNATRNAAEGAVNDAVASPEVDPVACAGVDASRVSATG